MTRRRAPQYSSLTSLMDVLFILVFASLAQAAGTVHAARAAAATQPARIPADAGAPDAGSARAAADARSPIPADATRRAGMLASGATDGGGDTIADTDARLRQRAIAELQRSLRDRNAIIARIAKTGMLTSIDVDENGETQRVHVGVPLIERVADPDVGTAYLGDRAPELRLCAIVRAQLERPDLGGDLVVIVPDVPLADLTVALVRGLRQDEERCMTDNGIGVLVDPGKTAPGQAAAGGPP